MGHKGPVLMSRCIGPGRARTQIPFNSIKFNGQLVERSTRGKTLFQGNYSYYKYVTEWRCNVRELYPTPVP